MGNSATEKTTHPATDLQEVLEHKTAIAQRLIAEQDEIINSELQRHEQAAFYIHLQSRCFKLYPLVVRTLLSLIEEPCERIIFRSIVNGRDIDSLARDFSASPKKINAM